jgi:PII-like signaling protein
MIYLSEKQGRPGMSLYEWLLEEVRKVGVEGVVQYFDLSQVMVDRSTA